MLSIPIDLQIILFSSILTVVFLLVHVFVIRTVGDSGVMIWLLRVFLSVSILGAGTLFFFFQHLPIGILLLGVFSVLLVYALIVFSYTLGIFGITLTSVRIQILSTIKEAGYKGITTKRLFEEYNRTKMIRQRLHRLVTSGEVYEKKGKFEAAHSRSPFYMHIRMQELFRRLYNG